MYGVQLRPRKQVIENAKIPKGLSCSWRPWRSRWIEKTCLLTDPGLWMHKRQAVAVGTWCQCSVNRCQESVAAEAGVAGNSTVEVETMGNLAGL